MDRRQENSCPGDGPALLGRDVELARLDELVGALRAGESRVLVVRGEPGVGKSALLHHAEHAAAGIRILRTAGVEPELDLAFAALHQLCAPLLDGIEHLPSPQRHALSTVFGLRAGPPPDRFLVGLAVLGLLSHASGAGPVLCVVDDAQWLDRASARVLSFVARRLGAEPIAVLLGVRGTDPDLYGLPVLDVAGLADVDAHALLDTVIHARLDRDIRDRIVAETHGNPLALLELPRGLTATQMAGGLGLLDAETLPGQIEQSFRHRVRALPEQTRLVLLVAAAEPVGDVVLVSRAAERLGVPLGTALAGGTDGLVTFDERVTFRHPLVRSALYRSADPARRRAVHLALAHVTDPRHAPDRRAWHLAAATVGPDEAVAVELERSALRAQARGGVAAGAAFLQRSAALTAEPGPRADRMLAAAEASLDAGELDDVRRLLSAGRAGPLDELQSGRAGVLSGQVAFASGAVPDGIGLLLDAAGRLAAVDARLARETYLTAWGMAVGVADQDTLLAVARAARTLPRADDPGPLELLLDGFTLLSTHGRAAAATALRQAAAALADLPARDVLRWGWVATAASSAIWDDAGLRALSARQVRVVRDAGALRELPYHLSTLGHALSWAGDFEGAAAAIAEGNAVAAATGTVMPPCPALRLLSLRGREAEAAGLLAATVQGPAAAGFGTGLSAASWASAVLYNGLARYPEAMRATQAVTHLSEPWISTWMLPEAVEAASRVGEQNLARAALDRLVESTEPFGTDFATGITARSRALLADGPDADDLYREAVVRLGRTQLRPELARAHLLYGEWLRRERRRVEARDELRTAYGLFAVIGMEAFAERARRELVATGQSPRRHAVEVASDDELTAQERQIALLVRDGLSNPEVGTRLFLSPRTIEWHLRKVFVKLRITSRRELRDALPRGELESAAG
ncbi:ATP-binding protein [Promicromonospora sp. NPDC057488]|uniref:ATP-binding protein n=1 Tax=Promicromonospora sp. NPDC057488 TaxID=3346147 RepID=UPI00366AA6C8